MVSNFSIGKKKFIDNKEKHEDLLERNEVLREKFIEIIGKDADLFKPLSRAYVMRFNTEDERKQKEEVLQKCLKASCIALLKVLEYTTAVLSKHLLRACSI